ncbi:MalY/PatB family protein [Microvirga makkahensis]|uniref:MalY/PatB family protein n=1 Tax=Microvirga makkahensis TaxID=1128670 RepID=UPI0031B5E660
MNSPVTILHRRSPERADKDFDFDEIIDRRSSNSVKWACSGKLLTPEECAADPLPMWVADMDFKAPQTVLDALTDAVRHGILGYPGGVPKSYVDAVINWQARRFGWDVSPDWLLQTPGVVTALKTIIQAFSQAGDTILIQPPVYAHFHDDPVLNGRRLAYAPLVLTEGGYRFDEKVFEAAIRDNTKIFILCSPHNPTGNVWSEEELRAMGEICARHGVLVVADEIHEDFVLNPQKRHVPFASLGDAFAQNSFTCTAPSKTFNLAGLQTANVIVPNPRLRGELRRQLERNGSGQVNVLGMVAAEAAYAHGEPWLEAMLDYVRANREHFARAINDATTRIRVLPSDSLYLSWMDCRGLGLTAPELRTFMLTRAGVWLDHGSKFGADGEGFMRVNLGCPRATVDEAITRITGAVASYP